MGGDVFQAVVIIGVVIAVFVAILGYAIRYERKLRQALQDLADARGWHYEACRLDYGTGGKTAKGFRLVPAGSGGDWQLEVVRRFSSGRTRRGGARTTSPGNAEFRLPEPVFEGGLAVFAAGSAGSTGGAATPPGISDNRDDEGVPGSFLGPDIERHIGQLRPFPAPEGSGLTVMGTADPSLLFDLPTMGRLLNGWASPRGQWARPKLVIGEAGLRLMVGHELVTPEAVTQMVDLGLELGAKAASRR